MGERDEVARYDEGPSAAERHALPVDTEGLLQHVPGFADTQLEAIWMTRPYSGTSRG